MSFSLCEGRRLGRLLAFHIVTALFQPDTIGQAQTTDGRTVQMILDGTCVRAPTGDYSRWGWRIAGWSASGDPLTDSPDEMAVLSLPHFAAALSDSDAAALSWVQSEVWQRLERLRPTDVNVAPTRFAQARREQYEQLRYQAASVWPGTAFARLPALQASG